MPGMQLGCRDEDEDGREFTLPPSGLGFKQDQGSSPGLLGSWEERRSQAWRPPGPLPSPTQQME